MIRERAGARWGAIIAIRPAAAHACIFDGRHFNPFIGAGTLGQTMDDFNGDAFDHSDLDFVGGAGINCIVTNGRPISNRPTAPGSPRWGAGWKKATIQGYNSSMGFSAQGSSYPVRENYLDLDPTYTDRAWPAAAAHYLRFSGK